MCRLVFVTCVSFHPSVSVYPLSAAVWGTYGSFPVLYSGLLTAFGSGPNAHDTHLALKLSFISSLNYAVSSVCGLVTGPICDLVGVRLLAAAALLFGAPAPRLLLEPSTLERCFTLISY